jgi:hypothetical protein
MLQTILRLCQIKIAEIGHKGQNQPFSALALFWLKRLGDKHNDVKNDVRNKNETNRQNKLNGKNLSNILLVFLNEGTS